MKRREFLKTSIAATAFGGTLSTGLLSSPAAQAGAPVREYYEWRAYKLNSGASHDLLDSYLAKAAIPTLNRLWFKSVAVFTENEPKDGPAVYVLIPYPSLEAWTEVTARLQD